MKIDRNKLGRLGNWAGIVVLVLYLAVMLPGASRAHDAELCAGLRVTVNDSTHTGYVTPTEIARELGSLTRTAEGSLLRDINTRDLKRILEKLDKIEDVNVVRTTDRYIAISVRPLAPVARVFDGDDSYYINKDGKRITADARYRIDVPVIYGHFPPRDTLMNPTNLLPLLDRLENDPLWGKMVTMIVVDKKRDVLLIPAIKGHVINLGNLSNLDSKFSRLERMYHKVIPVRGWDFYDTISVKWSGQVVATRRIKPQTEVTTPIDTVSENVDVTTMLTTEGVAPGQTRPGVAANNDKPIPGSKSATSKATEEKKSENAKSETTEKDNNKKKTQ